MNKMIVFVLLGVAAVLAWVALSKGAPQGTNTDEAGGGNPPPVPDPDTDSPVDPDQHVEEGYVRIGGSGTYSEGKLIEGSPFSCTVQIFHKGPKRKVKVAVVLGKGGGFSHQGPAGIPNDRMFVTSAELEASDGDRVKEVRIDATWPKVDPGTYDVLRIVAPASTSDGAATLLVGNRYDDDWDDDVFVALGANNQASVPEGAVYS